MNRTSSRFLLTGMFCLLAAAPVQAQITTVTGDFFNITRTVEQTADSVAFTADTLVLTDNGSGLGNFQDLDSIAVTFVQNRFRIVNDMLPDGSFDYVRARVRYNGGMTLRRQAYDGVQTGTKNGGPVLGRDGESEGKSVGLRPVYRAAWAIAKSSVFNSNPDAIRQFLTFQVLNPESGKDAVQIWNFRIKPNINNLMGLALPPDTTKDTLRAYHLDGSQISYGNVMSHADLAIVRLLPGTTRILMWVRDSAQTLDAGEYIGSFGDYSRGRYFLGDDALPAAQTRTDYFRPGPKSYAWGPGEGNPDEGMLIDGAPPEESPLRGSPLFQTLAPFWYNRDFPERYPKRPRFPCANPNPEHGLIPPYRIGEYAVAHDGHQPGLVMSAADTLRFFDAWGNRTWDRTTTPVLQALAYEDGRPADRTEHLTGYTGDGDMLRQTGQVVYRRLAYTRAGDSVRIAANALVRFTAPGNKIASLNALADTTGGFPRVWNAGTTARKHEAAMDAGSERIPLQWTIDRERTPVAPKQSEREPPKPHAYDTPHTGLKIATLANIPRRIIIEPDFEADEGRILELTLRVQDAFGNAVDDNERFFLEFSPFTPRKPQYRTLASFDTIPGDPVDSGRVRIDDGIAIRYLVANTGPDAVGAYRVRARASYSFPERNGLIASAFYPLRVDPFPRGNPPAIEGFSHTNIIPGGSANRFGEVFGPRTLMECEDPNAIDAGLGAKMGQTTALDSIDLYWDGEEWALCEECPDYTPPRIAVELTPSLLPITGDEFAEVEADVEATDERDADWRLVSITGGESPADIRDAEYGGDDDDFELRVRRGAVYTVTFEAYDEAGNTARVRKLVRVAW